MKCVFAPYEKKPKHEYESLQFIFSRIVHYNKERKTNFGTLTLQFLFEFAGSLLQADFARLVNSLGGGKGRPSLTD